MLWAIARERLLRGPGAVILAAGRPAGRRAVHPGPVRPLSAAPAAVGLADVGHVGSGRRAPGDGSLPGPHGGAGRRRRALVARRGAALHRSPAARPGAGSPRGRHPAPARRGGPHLPPPRDRKGHPERLLHPHPGVDHVITGKIGSGKTTLVRTCWASCPPRPGKSAGTAGGSRRPWPSSPRPGRPTRPQVPRIFSGPCGEHPDGLAEEAPTWTRPLPPLSWNGGSGPVPPGAGNRGGLAGTEALGGPGARTAAARMFGPVAGAAGAGRHPSALDNETEAEFWRRLFAHRGATVPVCRNPQGGPGTGRPDPPAGGRAVNRRGAAGGTAGDRPRHAGTWAAVAPESAGRPAL